MHLKCNHCQFVGDVEPSELRDDNYHLPCPRCGVVKIVPAGEGHCDFCFGQPITATYVTRAFDLPGGFIRDTFTRRSRRWAACAACADDIEHGRSDPDDLNYPITRMVNRACEERGTTDPRMRRGMHDMMSPLWRLFFENITEGPLN